MATFLVAILEFDSALASGACQASRDLFPPGSGAGADGATFEDAKALGRPIALRLPGQILFGNGSSESIAQRLRDRGLQHLLVVTSPGARQRCGGVIGSIRGDGLKATVFDGIAGEPTIGGLEKCLVFARQANPDGIVGLGGGSALDVAKLVAALLHSTQTVDEILSSHPLEGRSTFLACIPSTAGTGSEASPNAILLDETARAKRAAISPHLVPDIACVDPLLTHSLPPSVTAATGLDALCHCIEAFANLSAHPMVDLYALEGMRRISRGLPAALARGDDAEARSNVALGSLYGGLCLGPVNTAAVHALAYPLAGEFGVPHGVSIAVLFPHVLRFNLPAAPARFATIAEALGVRPTGSNFETAGRGLDRLAALVSHCPVARGLFALGVPREALPRLARSALTVTRLLKNNPRAVTEADAIAIYEAAF